MMFALRIISYLIFFYIDYIGYILHYILLSIRIKAIKLNILYRKKKQKQELGIRAINKSTELNIFMKDKYVFLIIFILGLLAGILFTIIDTYIRSLI